MPLWDITLLQGVNGGCTAVIVRVHHCLADGLSGVGLLNVLLDPSAVTAPLRQEGPDAQEEQRLDAPPERSAMTSLVEALTHSCFSFFHRIVMAESELLDLTGQVLAAAGKQPGEATTYGLNCSAPIPTSDQFVRDMREILAPTERLPFNVVCHGPQKYQWAELSIADMRAVKRVCGATLNDVALALVTSSIRHYAELHGISVAGRVLRIAIPVSIRGKGAVSDLGNQITFLPFTIPLDIRDLQELIGAIRERMASLRGLHLAELVSFAGTLLGMVPTAAQALAAPFVTKLPISVCNMICTNVPGPKVPLYLNGQKMLACYPYIATGGEMGMNCAILTYNGKAYFGFTADAQAMPDVECLGKLLRASFTELRKAVAIRSARPKRTATKGPTAQRAAAA
jgi:diacylglycerol O-acyltransferase